MTASGCKSVDPRVLRTRQLLHTALEQLLEKRDFEELSVQDITDAATLNRATFYDHYPDKFALLECTVANRFHDLLDRRGVVFDGTCGQAAKAIILGVCDFLASPVGIGSGRRNRLEPRLESAMVSVVRAMLLAGFRRHPTASAVSPELRASVASWAIYGGVKEWVQTSCGEVSGDAVESVWQLVSPVFGLAPARD